MTIPKEVTPEMWAEWRAQWDHDKARWAEMTRQMHIERDKREAKK